VSEMVRTRKWECSVPPPAFASVASHHLESAREIIRNWAKIAKLGPRKLKLLEDDVALLLNGAVCLKCLHA
jgi:hypothetical protein